MGRAELPGAILGFSACRNTPLGVMISIAMSSSTEPVTFSNQSMPEIPANLESDYQLYREQSLQIPRFKAFSEATLREHYLRQVSAEKHGAD